MTDSDRRPEPETAGSLMIDNCKVERAPRRHPRDVTGLCAEAQADGVPCQEVGRHCEICDRAVLER